VVAGHPLGVAAGEGVRFTARGGLVLVAAGVDGRVGPELHSEPKAERFLPALFPTVGVMGLSSTM